MAQESLGHRPALIDAANHVLLRHLHAVEEGVTKCRRVSERQHRLDFDTGALEVDQEERDPGLLLHRLICAHEAKHPVRVLREGRPGLLTIDDEMIAGVLGSRAQRREIASGAGLGVALTPKFLGAEDLRKESLLLSVGAKADDQWAHHRQTKHGKRWGSGQLHFLVEDEAARGVPTRATHFLRPVRRDPTFFIENAVPSGGVFGGKNPLLRAPSLASRPASPPESRREPPAEKPLPRR